MEIIEAGSEALGSQAERECAVDSQGYLYDPETGEVLGHQEIAREFRVDSDAAATWALKIRAELEAEVLAIDAQLEALARNLTIRKRTIQRRLAWWEWRFGSQVVAYARTKLSGKSRSVVWPWGRVKFRKTAGALRILDQAAAVEFAKAWLPDVVRVRETVSTKGLRAAIEAARIATDEDVRLACVAEVPPGESVTIETGVTAKKGVKP